MASDYGLNFGFRRSDESMRTSDGRLKTPATGTFRIGSLVTYDPAAPGFLKAAAANEVGEGATVGLLLQEDAWDRSIYQTKHLDSFGLGLALNNRNAVITSGAGTKVWFKNTAGSTRADGRVITAVTMVDLTGVAVKDFLTWDGSKFVKGAGLSDSMLRVTVVDSANGYVEAVLTR
jgi:hypothetical protein